MTVTTPPPPPPSGSFTTPQGRDTPPPRPPPPPPAKPSRGWKAPAIGRRLILGLGRAAMIALVVFVFPRVRGTAGSPRLVVDHLGDGAGQRFHLLRRNQPADFRRRDQLAVAAAIGGDHRLTHGHGLADRAGDAGACKRGIDDEVAGREHVRHGVAILDRRHAGFDTSLRSVEADFPALPFIRATDPAQQTG